MKRLPAVAALLWAGAALAAGVQNAASLMGQVPGLPATAQAAFAQWTYKDRSLGESPLYKAFEERLKQAELAGLPGQEAAQSVAAEYSTPEGQKKLAAMTLDHKLALAHQMSGGNPMMASGPMSPADIALIKDVQPYPQTSQVRQKVVAIRMKAAALEAQWDKEKEKIDAAQNAEYRTLAICNSEAGEPSGIAVRDLYLKYQDKRIKLASDYLPKFNPLLTDIKQTVAPEIAFADRAVASWTRISSPAMKNNLKSMAQGAHSNAINDAGAALGLVEDVSKKAATSVADRRNIEENYAHAQGC